MNVYRIDIASATGAHRPAKSTSWIDARNMPCALLLTLRELWRHRRYLTRRDVTSLTITREQD